MRAMSGQEIRQAIRGRMLSRTAPNPVRGLSIDSRTAKRDDVFFAIAGDNFDGHDFLEAALQKGCIAAVVEVARQYPQKLLERFPAGVIGVADTTTALLDFASYYRTVLPATVVAVTGSNGKTTVKNMINHILSKRLTGTQSPKSFNNEIGVPLTIASASAGDDYVICELGTNAPGEISKLARAIKPNIGVITNVAPAHLERLNSIEAIAVEKASLLGWLGPRDNAVVFADSKPLNQAVRALGSRMITFGQSPEANLRLTNYQQTGWSSRFELNNRDWIELAVPGIHNAFNAIAAIAVAARFGFTQQDAADALADFTGVDMRLQRVSAGEIEVINDAYNANPSSVRAAASVVANQDAKRKILILGDMFELGNESAEIHSQLGADLATGGFDLIAGVGQLAKYLVEAAASSGCSIAHYENTQAAKDDLENILAPGDLVLIKGSRGMKMDTLVDEIKRIGKQQ